LRQQWCIGRINGEFLARMENILYLYSLSYDPAYPLLCFDERPCVLRNDVVELLPMKPGRAQRFDYEYKRCGTCNLLVAFEPLSGFRIIEVSHRRTAQDYTRFMQRVARHYASAEKILLVQDNLNTHTPGSFYATLHADEAFDLAQCFEMHYTPKKASWLNMAEIEINAVVRQGLKGCRIGSIDAMSGVMEPLVKERNEKGITVNWQFTPEKAREKLSRHYDLVLSKK